MHSRIIYALLTYVSFFEPHAMAKPAPLALAEAKALPEANPAADPIAVPEPYPHAEPDAIANAEADALPYSFEQLDDEDTQLTPRATRTSNPCVGNKDGSSSGQYTCATIKWNSNKISLTVRLSIKDSRPIDNHSVYGYYIVYYKNGSQDKLSDPLTVGNGGSKIGDARDITSGNSKRIMGVRVYGCVKNGKGKRDDCKDKYVSNPYVAGN